MASHKACYRKLYRYKYQLVESYDVDIHIIPSEAIETPYILLSQNGLLTIRSHYAWDGASGSSFDTTTIMRASLVHDALYQLMRLNKLDHLVHRKRADTLFYDICREDGMWCFRAWYSYWALRFFGKRAALPGTEPPANIICLPL